MVDAIRRLLRVTVHALVAVVVAHDDVITDFELGDRRSDLLNDPDALVTEHDWEFAQTLGLRHHVGMTYSRGDHPDEQLFGSWRTKLYCGRTERLFRIMGDRSLDIDMGGCAHLAMIRGGRNSRVGQGRLARQSISTNAPTANAVTPTVVRAGRRSSGKKLWYVSLNSP